MSGHLNPGGQQFRHDNGAADPRVATALAAYQAGQGSEQTALTALAAARLLVPVVAVLADGSAADGDKNSEMVLPTLIGRDGRPAVLAFTSLDALARWRANARPVPAEADRVCRAAVADGCAVVIDVAGPVPLAVEGARLEALAAGQPVPPAHEDPDLRAEIEAAVAGEPMIGGFTLAPSRRADLVIRLRLAAGDRQHDDRQHDDRQHDDRQSGGEPGRQQHRGPAGGPAAPRRRIHRHTRPRRIVSMFRWLTAGESHGRALVAICEGVPAGVRVSTEDVAAALARRRAGYGRGARMTFEQDEVELTGGVRHGLTLGGPIAIRIANTEWPKWETVMASDPVAAETLDAQARNAPLTRPRPGHADLAGMQKFGHSDARPILERASARETAARVALGEVARRLLSQVLGIEILSHVVAIGQVRIPDEVMPGPEDAAAIDADPVRCFDAETSTAMVAEIDEAKKAGDTLGGVVEVLAFGLPPGLGSFTHWDRRLDARLAGALMSIQAIKGVEVGDGFTTAARRGSVAHDEIEATPQGVARRTNRAGGIEGGMSTGEVIRLRVAMKPISTVPRALDTIDTSTGEPAKAINQRSDATAVPAAGVVAEAMVALVLAEAAVEKFGGDSAEEMRRNAESYLKALVIS